MLMGYLRGEVHINCGTIRLSIAVICIIFSEKQKENLLFCRKFNAPYSRAGAYMDSSRLAKSRLYGRLPFAKGSFTR